MRRGGLMVSDLDSGSSGPGSSPGLGHCVVFFGKTLYSHSASFYPAMDWHPIQGGVVIFLFALCYRNQDNLRPLGHLSSNANFTFPFTLTDVLMIIL